MLTAIKKNQTANLTKNSILFLLPKHLIYDVGSCKSGKMESCHQGAQTFFNFQSKNTHVLKKRLKIENEI
jgi:hypothetical protein